MSDIFKIVGIVIGLITWIGCENDLEEVHRVINKDEVKMERATGVEMLYSDSAIVRIKITAPTLLSHLNAADPKKEFPDGIQIDFFDGEGTTQSSLTSKYAIQFDKGSKLLAKDSVVVYSQNDEKLETEELIWDDSQEMVYSDKFVKISTIDEVIYGFGFRANMDFSSWEIKKVQGRFKAENLKQDFAN